MVLPWYWVGDALRDGMNVTNGGCGDWEAGGAGVFTASRACWASCAVDVGTLATGSFIVCCKVAVHTPTCLLSDFSCLESMEAMPPISPVFPPSP
jgi:hypothetical protein